MTYLLDTDWIISFLDGRPEAVDLVRRVADGGIAISAIPYGEVYEGLLGGSSPVERRVQLEGLLRLADRLLAV
jgi:predicted nucleic acid-binding protein